MLDRAFVFRTPTVLARACTVGFVCPGRRKDPRCKHGASTVGVRGFRLPSCADARYRAADAPLERLVPHHGSYLRDLVTGQRQGISNTSPPVPCRRGLPEPTTEGDVRPRLRPFQGVDE